jgi:hypothetical protein
MQAGSFAQALDVEDAAHGGGHRLKAVNEAPLFRFVRHVQLPHSPPLACRGIMQQVYASKTPNVFNSLILLRFS